MGKQPYTILPSSGIVVLNQVEVLFYLNEKINQDIIVKRRHLLVTYVSISLWNDFYHVSVLYVYTCRLIYHQYHFSLEPETDTDCIIPSQHRVSHPLSLASILWTSSSLWLTSETSSWSSSCSLCLWAGVFCHSAPQRHKREIKEEKWEGWQKTTLTFKCTLNMHNQLQAVAK